jgi:heat-inducible transcriptional repressor
MTPRQAQLLQAIVEYYVQTASPVGSISLSRQFGVSPATIRAEMALLEQSGYITHPHTSAGRVPTDRGYRHYVNSLQTEAEKADEAEKETRLERAIDQRLDSAGEPTQAIKSAVDSLVDATNNLAVGMLGSNFYMSGLGHLFNQPEFAQIERVHIVARSLDNLEHWLREISPNARVNVYIGDENPIGKASGCSLVISRFASPYSDTSYVGVVGPTRQSYPRVMRLVEHVSERLEEVLNG